MGQEEVFLPRCLKDDIVDNTHTNANDIDRNKIEARVESMGNHNTMRRLNP